MIGILRNLYPNNWGPPTEYILEHAVYALLEQSEPVTLAALPKLLVDHNNRRKVVKNVTDPEIPLFLVAKKQLPKPAPARYKYSGPGFAPLAGFEVSTYGRF